MRALLLAGVVAFGWTGVANATVTQYVSQADFDAAAGSTTSYSFSGVAGVKYNPFTSGPLVFSSDTSDFGSLYDDGRYGSGIEYYSPINSGTVSITGGATAISFNLGTYYGEDVISISVDGAAQAPISTLGGYPITTFVGFTSDTPFSNLSFSITDSELDFISFQVSAAAATAVPEPASLALVGVGMAGIAAVRRRRVR